MTPDALFQIANTTALVGWLVLLASPIAPRLTQIVSGLGVVLALSVLYVALMLVFAGRADGGFDSLDSVASLFETRELLLAGWVHYLAFDLFIGAWIVRVARRDSLAFLLVVPCLVLTFLAGPGGLLLFLALRVGLRPRSSWPFEMASDA